MDWIWYVFSGIITLSIIASIIISIKNNGGTKAPLKKGVPTIPTVETKTPVEKEVAKDVPLKIKHRYGPKPWSAVWGTIGLFLILGIAYNYSRVVWQGSKIKISSPVQQEIVVVLQIGDNQIPLTEDGFKRTYTLPSGCWFEFEDATVDYCVNRETNPLPKDIKGKVGEKKVADKLGNSYGNLRLKFRSDSTKDGYLYLKIWKK